MTVRVNPPPTPLMTIVYIPVGVVAGMVILNLEPLEYSEALKVLSENIGTAPWICGSIVSTERFTSLLKPLSGETVMVVSLDVAEDCPPSKVTMRLFEDEMLKSGGGVE